MNSPSSENQDSNIFHNDRPISRLADDRLGRSEFSRRLALSLARWQQRESIVVALYGPWGSGKSSIKTMVIEHLAGLDKGIRPTVIELSPWEISGTGAVEPYLYGRLAYALIASGTSEEENAVGQKLLSRFRGIAKIGGVVGNAAAFAVGCFTNDAGLAAGIATAAAGLNQSDSVLSATEGGPKIEEPVSKQSLEESLRLLANPLIIVIDDLDRLEPAEIRLILRMLKANLDLPNITYFLSFERSVVESALNQQGDSGSAALEKFVQVGLEVPETGEAGIAQAINRGMERILTKISDGTTETNRNSERLGEMWNSALRHFIKSLRDVSRFLNVVEFKLGGMIRGGVLQVNLADFLAIQCLCVFAPAVHREIGRLRGRLSALNSTSQDGPELLRELLAHNVRIDAEAVSTLLQLLFPRLDRMGSTFYDEDVRHRRICTPMFVERYFASEVNAEESFEAEVKEILLARHDHAAATLILREALDRGHLIKFLQRLRAEDELEKSQSLGWFMALSEIADCVTGDVDSGTFMELPASFLFTSFVSSALKHCAGTEEKIRFLEALMREGAGLYLSSEIACRVQNLEKPETLAHGWPKITPSPFFDSISFVTSRISSLSVFSEDFISRPAFDLILRNWKQLDPQTAKAWVASQLGNQTIAGRILGSLVRRTRSFPLGRGRITTSEWISWQILESWAPWERWEEAIDAWRVSSADPLIARWVALFEKAATRRNRQQPDEEMGYLIDEDEDIVVSE